MIGTKVSNDSSVFKENICMVTDCNQEHDNKGYQEKESLKITAKRNGANIGNYKKQEYQT